MATLTTNRLFRKKIAMSAHGTIRFGILGTSRVAKKSVLPALRSSSVSTVGMVGSRDVDEARAVAGQFNCPSFGTYEDVLNNKAIDAVYISLPNALHEEWAVKAAQAGKHVWCEKPAALSYASARRMVDVGRKNGVRIMEGFMFVHHPQHAKVRAMIQAGELGDLLTFNGCFSYPMPEPGSNRLNRDLRGGSYFDAAVYPIRASRMIFATEPEHVACNLSIGPETGVDVKADMLLMYPGGKSAHVSSVFGGYFQSRYDVLGDSARVSALRAYAVPPDRPTTLLLERDDTGQEIIVSPADHFQLMAEDFCREIGLGDASDAPYEKDLLAQAGVVEAGLIAHREKRTVSLSEVTG